MKYEFYILDSETSGMSITAHDIIELSIIRLSNNEQRTWCIKPFDPDCYEPAALKINGHKLEDLKHQTQYGRDTYQDPNKVIIEIENWLMEDGLPSEDRCTIGQNVSFDLTRLEQLWSKCNSRDSYPFGRRYLDTMVIEMFLDYCKGDTDNYYNLNSIIKKYGVKNDKKHTAAADTKATKELFEKQVELFKKILAHAPKMPVVEK